MFHLAYIDDLCSLTCVSFFNIIGLNSLSGTIPELPLSLEEPACLLGMCHYIRLSISSSRRLLSTWVPFFITISHFTNSFIFHHLPDAGFNNFCDTQNADSFCVTVGQQCSTDATTSRNHGFDGIKAHPKPHSPRKPPSSSRGDKYMTTNYKIKTYHKKPRSPEKAHVHHRQCKFDAGWGTCDSYHPTNGLYDRQWGMNFGHCQYDYDYNCNQYAFEACCECQEFDAGWGDCSTYAFGNSEGYDPSFGYNYDHCDTDCTSCNVCASDVCSECA